MQPRVVLRTAFFLVMIVLLAGLLAGCGGGGQAEGDSQDNDSGGSEQQQNGGGGSNQQNEGTQRERAERTVKIALGTIASVTPDENEFTLQPSAEEQGEEPIAFRARPATRVTIGGQEAKLVALQEGQQAKVRYVTVEGTNRARAVEVIGE